MQRPAADTAIRIALYQPDIPQNVGAMIRLCACLGVGLDIIEPCGFPWSEKKIRESALDYLTLIKAARHTSWQSFHGEKQGRLILMTTKASQSCYDFTFQAGDILLAGRESAGVPDEIHRQADARICVPMAPGARSLNIVNATAMMAGEALRQLQGSR